MDYSRLRDAALQSGEDEEAVTVDTRALIDKVLARYSGEWTTLRELIQNAADAQATTVKIKWETLPSTQVPLPPPTTTSRSELLKHTIVHHTLRRLVVQNDGQPFTKTDWGRLKRIAEGNPDETKIGAFGVGFYSVFADCEEPFVSSGGEAMAFYWKGNALFTRKLQLSEAQRSPETAFVLDYRNATTPLPNLLSVSQFLATSLTFVALQTIEFWIDDWQVLALRKKSSPSVELPIPAGLETRTKDGLMRLARVERTSAQIDATFMNAVGWKPQQAGAASSSSSKSHDGNSSGSGSGNNNGGSEAPSSLRSFFSRLTASTPQAGLRGRTSAAAAAAAAAAKEEKAAQDAIAEDVTATSTSSIFLRVTAGQVQTQVAAAFAAELERATKKPPPKMARLAVLTSSYDETVATEASTATATATNTTTQGHGQGQSGQGGIARAVDVFASVLPNKKPGGRIFIGFPTTQTTGAGMHVSAPSVIPTVEREAIDLNACWVLTWNMEMLRVAGIMTRLAFSNEMADLHDKLRRMAEADNSTAGSKSGGGGVGNNSKKNAAAATITAAHVAKCVPEALHILKTYTFGDSTPSARVAQIVEEAFWTSFRKASIEVYSSQGVLSTTRVRVASEELGRFVSGIPVILPEMTETPFVRKLADFGLIKNITVDDVCQELAAKALDRDQLHHFIAWVGKSAASGELDPPSIERLLDVAVATVGGEGEEGEGGGKGGSSSSDSGEIIALGSIKNYLHSGKIPYNMPVPPTTLPFAFTSRIAAPELKALGWEPLEIVPWLRFLIESGPTRGAELDVTKSPKFAAQVLGVLSKNWDNLSQSSRNSVVSALQHVTVMPTRTGMRKPAESFFPSVRLFDDLPVLQDCQGVKEKFLAALGVRKTVDLETIFTRLLAPTMSSSSAEEGAEGNKGGGAGAAGKRWSHMELIKYLASVRDDIPADDMKKLKESRLCPAEAGPPGLEPTKASAQLYRVSELFEPKDALRTLGLPILQWPGPPGSFRPSSVEGRFLSALGLRPHPSVPELVDMMASTTTDNKDAGARRKKAMAYYIANHHINNYVAFNVGVTNKAILPLEGSPNQLVPPSACYTDERAAVLGYNILAKELHAHAAKFGVARDPPITSCVDKLIARPPTDAQSATTLFGYFTTRLGDLGPNDLAKLRDAPIVPVVRRKQESSSSSSTSSPLSSGIFSSSSSRDSKTEQQLRNFDLVRPQNVYLGASTTYGDIFDFVDFGADANAFLFKCGARSEPTKIEVAQLACAGPARLLDTLQSPDKYLNLLRFLADDLALLRGNKELWRRMKTSAFLLGSKEISSSASSSSSSSKNAKGADLLGDDAEEEEEEEEVTPVKHYQLATAGQIVILDDFISYRLFKHSLLCAPEEDGLEAFYMALGSETLGGRVQEDLRIGAHTEKQEGAGWLRNHVLERSKLFLYEYARYKRDAIKHDARWLEKNLTVEVVRSVALRRSLKGVAHSHTEKRSAAVCRNGAVWTLYVAAATSDRGSSGSRARPDMYQVGQAVCQLLLSRPGQQAYLFFEPFLKLDLLDLRARGYNVDRILRAKAAEARIAEEERRKALEEEERKIREREREWASQSQASAAATRSGDNNNNNNNNNDSIGVASTSTPTRPEQQQQQHGRMPGSFDDSPSPPEDSKDDNNNQQLQRQPSSRNTNHSRSKRGLFSHISRRLGFEADEDGQNFVDNFLGGSGSGSGSTSTPHSDHASISGGSDTTKQPQQTDDGRVTSPAIVQQNLLDAIRSTRAHDPSQLFSRPRATEVKEQATYCDAQPAHNMRFVAEAPRGMRVFVDRELADSPDSDAEGKSKSKDGSGGGVAGFLTTHASAIAQFESVLRDVADVYGLATRALHIFYDEKGGTIAFNTRGSVFCNLRFFLQLHLGGIDNGNGGNGNGAGRVEARTWWWVVLAHELAHNLVEVHDAQHSYYTESFIQQYFGKMMAKALVWQQAGESSSSHAPASSASTSVPEPPPPYERRSLLD